MSEETTMLLDRAIAAEGIFWKLWSDKTEGMSTKEYTDYVAWFKSKLVNEDEQISFAKFQSVYED